jgi:hypothetical protein
MAIWIRPNLLRAAFITATILLSAQGALAQFTQQGPKLVGTFSVGVWVWTRRSGAIWLERVARQAFYGALWLVGIGVTNVASAETYTLTDLGIVGIGSNANAINDAGQVVGYCATSMPATARANTGKRHSRATQTAA